MQETKIDFNLDFLDIAWCFEEHFFATECTWGDFMFSYIGKMSGFFNFFLFFLFVFVFFISKALKPSSYIPER